MPNKSVMSPKTPHAPPVLCTSLNSNIPGIEGPNVSPTAFTFAMFFVTISTASHMIAIGKNNAIRHALLKGREMTHECEPSAPFEGTLDVDPLSESNLALIFREHPPHPSNARTDPHVHPAYRALCSSSISHTSQVWCA